MKIGIDVSMMQNLVSDGWETVTPPATWGWSLPFTIQKNGRTFRVAPGFSLRDRAGITVAKTYYVDSVNGNDSNTGLTAEQAFKTLNKVNTQADADRVYLLDGSYFARTDHPYSFGRDIEFIGIGTVYWTSDTLGLSFTKTGTNYWTADLTTQQYISAVYDFTWLTANYNHPRHLDLAASAAACDSTPGTYFEEWNGTKRVYIHTFDSREPDSDIKCLGAINFRSIEDNRVTYFENINFLGGISFQNLTATGGQRAYIKDCWATTTSTKGADEVIYQNCSIGGNADDAANHDEKSAIDNHVIEIDCIYGDCGEATNHQCSTGHNSTYIVRINGEYGYSTGQNIADGGDKQSWNLGTTVVAGVTGVGFFVGTGTSTTWLDSCTSTGNTTDISVSSSCTCYYRDFVGGGSNLNDGGTLEEY